MLGYNLANVFWGADANTRRRVARAAGDVLVGRIDVQHLAHVGVGHPDCAVDVLRDLTESRLALTQSALALLSVGDIGGDDDRLFHVAGLSSHGCDGEGGPDTVAVGAFECELGVEHLLAVLEDAAQQVFGFDLMPLRVVELPL